MTTTELPRHQPSVRSASVAPRRRLSRRARHVVLIVHIVASVAWIGVNLAMLALVVAGLTSSDGQVVAVAQQAVTIIVPPVVPPLAVVTVVTGLVLGSAPAGASSATAGCSPRW